ncbi:NAD-dependent succinate-semialdehyde dehydrogenase [Aspergillus stella-maris]|uniref:NAD-dependent succinate-semialdehyde dehydrogenase n=1 Tax=Aspergillus stella-maris TaxID=1810926 RepID=UPI003CCDDC89
MPPRRQYNGLNPATCKLIALLEDSDERACHQAIQKAQTALKELKTWLPKDRARVLLNWGTRIIQATNDLAAIITAESGKLLSEAKEEVKHAADFLSWFAGEAHVIDGATRIPGNWNAKVHTINQPIGIAGIITPWTYPAAIVTRKMGAAFAAGCPCILKPSPETPLTAMALATLAYRAGIPRHAFQFSFAGSAIIGRTLAARCMLTMKRVDFALGGNAPLIVFSDANIEKAVQGIMDNAFRLAGQSCACANRIYVQADIHDAVVKSLVARVRELKLGKGNDKGTILGPLISSRAAEKVQKHVQDAVENGATILVGGNIAKNLGTAFFEPTVLVNVDPYNSLCMMEETSGPVVPIVRFHVEKWVLAQANRPDVGLAGYIFTKNVARASRISEALEVGMVGVNTGIIDDPHVPFGGVKGSGIGREGSSLGIYEYLEVKSVTTNVT